MAMKVVKHRGSDPTMAKNAKRKLARRVADEAEQEELKVAFQMFDMNGDGYIDGRELRKILKEMGQNHTKEEVKEIIKSVDRDGNGKIDFEEFVHYMKPKINQRIPEEELKHSFQVFDCENTGYINKSKLKAAMKKLREDLTKKEIDALMESVDISGDGLISFAEFRIMMYR